MIQAGAAEKRGDYKEALRLYTRMETRYAGTSTGKLALFKKAVLYDHKLHDPGRAWNHYQKYLKGRRGRFLHRAEVRLKALEKFKDANLNVYREYIKILNRSTVRSRKKSVTPLLEKFIAANPGEPYIDDALLWLGNEYRGFRRIMPDGPGGEKRIDLAIGAFRKMVQKYPDSPNLPAALKNLGDCYTLKKDYEQAKTYYARAAHSGGARGRLMVGQFPVMAAVQQSRSRLYLLSLLILAALTGLLLFLLPIREFNGQGLRLSLRHMVFLFPAALVTILATFLPDISGEEEHHGQNGGPYILMVIFTTALLGVFLNGFLLEIRKRKEIKYGALGVTILALLIPLNYVALYHFGLLSQLEKNLCIERIMNSKRNRFAALLGVCLLTGILWLLHDSIREKPMTTRPPSNAVSNSSHCCNLDESNMGRNKRQTRPGKPMGRLTLREHPVDDSHQFVTAETKGKRSTYELMTEPLRNVAGKFKALSYTGQMEMQLPTLATSGSERYGSAARLWSRFWFLKDQKGNYYLRQETECSRKQSRYNHTAYNGELYYINGKFYFFDSQGDPLEGARLNRVLFRLRNDGQEPLVRRSWIQLIKDLKGGIRFLEESKGGFRIRGINAKYQGALQLEHIEGSLSKLEQPEVMLDASLTGSARHDQGFMKGAQNQFEFELRVTNLKRNPEIRLP